MINNEKKQDLESEMTQLELKAFFYNINFKERDYCAFHKACILDDLNQPLNTKILFSPKSSSEINFNKLVKPMILDVIQKNEKFNAFSEFVKNNNIFCDTQILIESMNSNCRIIHKRSKRPSEYYELDKLMNAEVFKDKNQYTDFVSLFKGYKIEFIEFKNEELRKPYIEASIQRIKGEVEQFFEENIITLSEIHNVNKIMVEFILEERIQEIKNKYDNFYNFVCNNNIENEIKIWNKLLLSYSKEKENEDTLVTS
jgi:hypothetical protein